MCGRSLSGWLWSAEAWLLLCGFACAASAPAPPAKPPVTTKPTAAKPPPLVPIKEKDKKPRETTGPAVVVEGTGRKPATSVTPVTATEREWFVEMYGAADIAEAQRLALEEEWNRKSHAERTLDYENHRTKVKDAAAHALRDAQEEMNALKRRDEEGRGLERLLPPGDAVTPEEQAWYQAIFGSLRLAADKQKVLDAFWANMTRAERQAIHESHVEALAAAAQALAARSEKEAKETAAAKTDKKEQGKPAGENAAKPAGENAAKPAGENAMPEDPVKAQEKKWYDEMYGGVDLTREERQAVEEAWGKMSPEERKKAYDEYRRLLDKNPDDAKGAPAKPPM